MHGTGISNHKKMILSVLRKTFAKGEPETVFYDCYKKYDQRFFNKALQNKISQFNLSFEKFFGVFRSTLDTFALNNPFTFA